MAEQECPGRTKFASKLLKLCDSVIFNGVGTWRSHGAESYGDRYRFRGSKTVHARSAISVDGSKDCLLSLNARAKGLRNQGIPRTGFSRCQNEQLRYVQSEETFRTA